MNVIGINPHKAADSGRGGLDVVAVMFRLVVNGISSDYGVQDGVRFAVSSPAALPQAAARFRAQAALLFVYFSWAESRVGEGGVASYIVCAERSMQTVQWSRCAPVHFSRAPVQAFPKPVETVWGTR